MTAASEATPLLSVALEEEAMEIGEDDQLENLLPGSPERPMRISYRCNKSI